MKKKNLIKTLFLIGMLLGGTISPVVASSSPDNWWPVQKGRLHLEVHCPDPVISVR